MNGTMQFNGTVQIHPEQIGTMVMRNSPSFDEEEDVDEYSDDDDIGSIREPRVPASAVSFSDSTAKFKRKFQQPIAFQFPSFHGFEGVFVLYFADVLQICWISKQKNQKQMTQTIIIQPIMQTMIESVVVL